MFRVGEKVLCIDDIPLYDKQGPMDITKKNIYTVEDCSEGYVVIFETGHFYSPNRFVSLSKIRKQKLKQLMKCLK